MAHTDPRRGPPCARLSCSLAAALPAPAQRQEQGFHLDPLILEVLQTTSTPTRHFQFRDDPGRRRIGEVPGVPRPQQRLPSAELHSGATPPTATASSTSRRATSAATTPATRSTTASRALEARRSTTTRSRTASATTALLWTAPAPGVSRSPTRPGAVPERHRAAARANRPASTSPSSTPAPPFLETAATSTSACSATAPTPASTSAACAARLGRSTSSTRTATAPGPTAPPSASTTSPSSSSRSTTTPRAPSCAASGTAERAALRFGYRHSDFENDISTLFWDNPFRPPTRPTPAYPSPGSGSIGGSAAGFADLAPDNDGEPALPQRPRPARRRLVRQRPRQLPGA